MDTFRTRVEKIQAHRNLVERARKFLLEKGETFIVAEHCQHGRKIFSYQYKLKSSLHEEKNDPVNAYATPITTKKTRKLSKDYFDLVVFTKAYSDDGITVKNIHNGWANGHWSFSINAKLLMGSCALVQDLHTPRQFQGRGLTKPLFLSVQADLGEVGFESLQAFSPSAEGRRFYASCNWQKLAGWTNCKYIYSPRAYRRKYALGERFKQAKFSDDNKKFCTWRDNLCHFVCYKIHRQESLLLALKQNHKIEQCEWQAQVKKNEKKFKMKLKSIKSSERSHDKFTYEKKKYERLLKSNKKLVEEIAKLTKHQSLNERYEEVMKDEKLRKKLFYSANNAVAVAVADHVKTEGFKARSFHALKTAGIGKNTFRILKYAQRDVGEKLQRRRIKRKIPCKWGGETITVRNTATVLESTEKDFPELLKTFIRKELIPHVVQIEGFNFSHAFVDMFDALTCFFKSLDVNHQKSIGLLLEKSKLAVALLKDGLPQARTGLSRDLLVVSLDIINKVNVGDVWDKIIIGIFDVKEGGEEEAEIDKYLNISISKLEQKIKQKLIKIPSLDSAYTCLGLICRMDLKAVQFTT